MKNLKTKLSYVIYFVLSFVLLNSCDIERPDNKIMIKPYIITGKYMYEEMEGKIYCKYLYQDINGKHNHTYDLETLYNVGDTIK